MSVTECETLISAQITGVITVILSGAVTIGLVYKLNQMLYGQVTIVKKHLERELYSLDCIITSILTLGLVFGLLCVIFYGVFATSYFLTSDDDTNIEGDDIVDMDAYYSYSLYLWIVAVVLNAALIVTAGGKDLNTCLLCKSTAYNEMA